MVAFYSVVPGTYQTRAWYLSPNPLLLVRFSSPPVRKSITVDGLQLFVGQLPNDTRSQDLRNTFAKYGRVSYVRVMPGINRCGKRTSNYAFIRFQRQAAVNAALADRPITLCNGHLVNVSRFKMTVAAMVD